MDAVVVAFILGSLAELLIYSSVGWPMRKGLVWLVTAGLIVSAGVMAGLAAPLLAAIYISAVPYRVVNLQRLLYGNSSLERLRRSGRQSFFWLALVQLSCVTAAYGLATDPLRWSPYWLLAAISTLVLLGMATLAVTFLRSQKRMQGPVPGHGYASRSLPTVTVAIPARNETDDLEECLRTLTASTYPKLEIIVLDDCSQERRTPEIIRGFAHNGVRFVAGKTPPEKWLAKNFAYQQLIEAANGEIVLFCGVDVRFEPHTVTMLIESMLDLKADVCSFMPVNHLLSEKKPSLLIQPMRYAWEVAVPRNWQKRPPLLSTCWLAKKTFLQETGSFAAVHRTILPERYFARRAQSHNNYRFLSTLPSTGLYTVKATEEQRQTALRMRYPQLHRRLELVWLLSVLELAMLLWPAAMVLYGVLSSRWLLFSLGVISLLLLAGTFAAVVRLTYRAWSWQAMFLAPLALCYDILLLSISMERYEFSEVYWKGRNICIPLMQAIPALPKLS